MDSQRAGLTARALPISACTAIPKSRPAVWLRSGLRPSLRQTADKTTENELSPQQAAGYHVGFAKKCLAAFISVASSGVFCRQFDKKGSIPTGTSIPKRG